MQARKSTGERSTLDLKPMRKDTQSPKQEQSVALQTGPWSNKNFFKKKKEFYKKKKSLASCGSQTENNNRIALFWI